MKKNKTSFANEEEQTYQNETRTSKEEHSPDNQEALCLLLFKV